LFIQILPFFFFLQLIINPLSDKIKPYFLSPAERSRLMDLTGIYHHEIPDFIREAAATAPMQRLKGVGMNCGCEYTSFPQFSIWQSYTRFDHSLGAALITWHFTSDPRQALAALFHDIATPVVSHVVDFLRGDHETQGSTEAGTREMILGSKEILLVCRA
jgi:HD superfamily phosphohydrolase